MKRIIALLLSIVTILSVFTCLSGCSNSESTITKGEWLYLLTDSFGMYSYTDVEPHTNTVDSENEFFPYVQMAYEWGIIDDVEIDINEKVTKGYLAETLVNCVDFIDTEEMSEEEITEYAVENNYVAFEYRGRTDNIRYVTLQEAQDSVELAYNIWIDRKYETIEEITVSDEVYNLADGILSSADVFVNIADNTVTIPEDAAKELSVGDTFIIPQNNVDSTAAAYQVEKIDFQNGYVIITTSEATLEETIQDLKFSGSASADLNNVEITDGAGNVINAGSITGTSSTSSAQVTNLVSTVNSDYNVVQCASGQLGFTVDGLSISGTVSGDSISFSIKGDIPTNSKSGLKVTVNKSYEISDISLDYDWDFKGFSLDSAYAKLNYTVKDTTGVSFSGKKEGALFYDQRTKPTLSNILSSEKRTKPTLSNILSSEIRSSAAAKGAKTITICSFPIVNGGVGRIDVDIKAKISVTGSVELIVTTHNSNGIEYKNGNIRYIKQKSCDTDLNIKAKIEATLYAGVSIKALKMNLLGVGFEGGIGVEFKTIAHLVNSDNVEIDQLSIDGNGEYIEATISSIENITYDEDGKTYTAHIDLCGEITTYFILKFKVDDDCALADIINGKAKKSGGVINLEIEIFGKSNAKIDALCTHIEDWTFMDECTRKYDSTKSDETEQENDTTATDENNVQNGEALDIDTYFHSLLIGNTASLSITQLPDGYEESDVLFSSSNINVATVDSNGKITAIGEGTAEIIVYIEGTDYQIKCSVVVSSIGENNFTGISV